MNMTRYRQIGWPYLQHHIRQRLTGLSGCLLSLLLNLPALGHCDDSIVSEPELPAAVPVLVQHCFPCHGPQGQSGSPAIPSLAGLPRDYLQSVLRSYRHGGRFSTVMGRLMQAYSEGEIEIMADYFSGQSYTLHKQQTDWRLADRGRLLHRQYCRDCHGDSANPADAGVPPLQGQWMDYLRWTLRDYLVGINQGNEEMAIQLSNLLRRQGPEGVESLIHYYGKAIQ